jgi:hypothetical protein
MNNDLFLNDRYICSDKISKQKINCEHWSYDQNNCSTYCSLKKASPTSINCFGCKERKQLDVTQITVNKTEQPKTTDKIISYAKAEASQFVLGKVSDEVYNERKSICQSCEFLTNPKPEIESLGWCKGGCGCKIGNPRAALSEKLYMPALVCPKRKFGTAQGTGFNASDALNSVKGVATSLIELAKTTNK